MRKIKRIIGFILLIVLVSAGALTYMGYSAYKSAIAEKSLEEAVSEIRNSDSYTKISEIPNIYIDAVISVEDRRFFYHPGVDPIGIVRAVVTDIKQKKLAEGGSSITQQLAKNMYFMQDNSPVRKIAEIFTALDLEKKYTKEEILELYFNGIYYGSGYYNIYDAAMGYFNKKPQDMTDYECTLLAGIPNAPSVYSPKVNPELAEKRRKKVVKTMIECGVITEEQGENIKQK